MVFERYASDEKATPQKRGAFCRIDSVGGLSLSAEAVRILGDPSRIDVFYDQDRAMLGISATGLSGEFRVVGKGTHTVAILRALRHWGIDVGCGTGRMLFPESPNDDGIFEISLPAMRSDSVMETEVPNDALKAQYRSVLRG